MEWMACWTPPKTIAMIVAAVINAFCLGAAVSIRSDSGNRPRDDRDRLIPGEVKRFSSLNFLLRVEAEGDWYGCIHGPLRFALAKTGGRRGVKGTGHDRFILNGRL